VLGLDRDALTEEYGLHARSVANDVDALASAVQGEDEGRVRGEWLRASAWLAPERPFVALTRDIIEQRVKPRNLSRWGLDPAGEVRRLWEKAFVQTWP
jgi:hypothetical protein